MREIRPDCPRCGKHMQEGFVVGLDAKMQLPAQSEWVEGTPMRGLFGLKLRGRHRLPITTYRCTKCGHLESFAQSA